MQTCDGSTLTSSSILYFLENETQKEECWASETLHDFEIEASVLYKLMCKLLYDNN